MQEATVIVAGNLAADPEFRFLPDGTPVASFAVATTQRKQVDGKWIDGAVSYHRVSVWREQATHVAESLRKGDRVFVSGVLRSTRWTDKRTGDVRYGWEITADEVAASLRFANVRPVRSERGTSGRTPEGEYAAPSTPGRGSRYPAPTAGTRPPAPAVAGGPPPGYDDEPAF